MLDDVLSLTWKMANIMQLRGRLLENSATWKILRPHLFKSFSSWRHKQTTLTHTWTTVVSLLYVIIPPTKVHDIIVACSLDWFKWACMKFASCKMAAWHCGVLYFLTMGKLFFLEIYSIHCVGLCLHVSVLTWFLSAAFSFGVVQFVSRRDKTWRTMKMQQDNRRCIYPG